MLRAQHYGRGIRARAGQPRGIMAGIGRVSAFDHARVGAAAAAGAAQCRHLTQDSLNQRRRSLGRPGGKDPGSRLSAAQQVNVAREGQTSLVQTMLARRLVHQPAHGVVGQHPAVELLAHAVGGAVVHAGNGQRRQAAGGVAHVYGHLADQRQSADHFGARGHAHRAPAVRG